MLESIGVNILSAFAFLLIVIVVSWIILRFTHRADQLRFFGVDESRRIIIYLSNLRVITGGAIGIDGQQRSYQGSAAAFGEMQVANRFRDLFNYLVPSFSEKPGILSKILISDIQVQLLPSPLLHDQVESSSSFVTLGSPAYNAASDFVETTLHSQARFRKDGQAIHVGNVPAITDATYGFVERIVDYSNKRHIFYAAGLSELGTVGAAYFLVTEWERLHRKYRDKTPFVIMLRLMPNDFRRWSIVFEL